MLRQARGRLSVTLVTAAEAVGLDDDAPVLEDALRRCGVDVRTCVWDDEAVDWSATDLAVLRSTWDYPRRREAFVRWATRVDAAAALRNRPAVVAWNSDKRYLLELADRGVTIVPSTVHAPGDGITVPADRGFVVKPTVSAGSQDTARYAADEREQALVHAGRLHAQGRDVLIQPYVERVDDDGETALVYVGGQFSHAIRKGPILAGVTETVGGLFAAEQIDPRSPRDRERAVAEAALDAVPFDRADLLYARVDLLPGRDGRPLVLEVELVEPSLFLRFDDVAADRFASAIVRCLAAATTPRGMAAPG
jgi:glutathione synthase/RimK-type ligase-like ATP-grasp enzyme